VIHRTLPAMAAALGGCAGPPRRPGLGRPRLLSPLGLSYPTYSFYGDEPPSRLAADKGWVLSTHTWTARATG
jgi:hypothetical protein